MTTPRERRHEITRQAILDAARKILVTEGLGSLSMRALAEQADYSPSAIYKYFASKEDILQAIRAEGWVLAAQLENGRSLGGLTPPEKLIASGLQYLEFARTYPEHYLLMFNSADIPPVGVGGLTDDPRFGGLIAAVQEGVDQGYFRLPPGYTPTVMAVQLWTSSHGIAMLELTTFRASAAEFQAMCEQMMRLFIASFTIR